VKIAVAGLVARVRHHLRVHVIHVHERAEAGRAGGTRGRALERKVLQAASMGYSKGVAAGKASDAAARDAAARELETLRRELEDARSALGDVSVAGGSVYNDAASTPDDASALGAARRADERERIRQGYAPLRGVSAESARR